MPPGATFASRYVGGSDQYGDYGAQQKEGAQAQDREIHYHGSRQHRRGASSNAAER